LGGNKTKSFFFNIAFPDQPADVTIDRHALAVVLGRKVTDAEQKRLSGRKYYQEVADAYRRAADILGILPLELQAATWCSWRERYAGLKLDPI
jgi:hypothetical protein